MARELAEPAGQRRYLLASVYRRRTIKSREWAHGETMVCKCHHLLERDDLALQL
jgi:hypothetical protein